MSECLFNALFQCEYHGDLINQNLIFKEDCDFSLEQFSDEQRKAVLLEKFKNECMKLGITISELKITQIYNVEKYLDNVERE